MTRETIQTNFDQIVEAIRLMLNAQKEYFSVRKMGYDGKAQKEKCKPIEQAARELFKHLHTSRPDNSDQLYKDYNHFLDRVKVLLIAQYNYFQDYHNYDQLKKCKALESEMRDRIKKYIDNRAQAHIKTMF